MMQAFIDLNRRLCRRFDTILAPEYRVDGSSYFRHHAIADRIAQGQAIIDLGAGRIPLIAAEAKQRLNLTVTGIDLLEDELLIAPAGSYDRIIAADATRWRGDGTADLILSHCLFEHVDNTAGAWAALASGLKPGGSAMVFAPCGNAAFARLNLVVQAVANRWKRSFMQHGSTNDGWFAFYDHCTPKGFTRLAQEAGLEVVGVRAFWSSAYFRNLAPAHIAWRLYQGLSRVIAGDQAAESFMIEVRRPA